MSVPHHCSVLNLLFIALVLAPFAADAQTPDCPSGSAQQTLVQPPAGPLCGTSASMSIPDQSKNVTVFAYRGIPYAQPPTPANNLRWKNPVAFPTWTQARAATAFQNSCPSSTDCPSTQSEDCLYLNVWVPQGTSKPSNLPVMVFIHGGAFVIGSGGSPTSDLYDGSYMAARDNVVVVTFNYRLGALGGLINSTHKITDSINYNFGFRDQILALNWVKNNIASFGGNATNVTIFGESAGAMSVGLHTLSSTQSSGLFKAVLMESNPLGLPYKNMTEADTLGQQFARLVMLCNGIVQPIAACMNNKTACQLVKGEQSLAMDGLTLLSGKSQNLLAWAPAIDDPQNPLPNPLLKGQPIAAAGNLAMPMLLGTNRDEGYAFVQLYLNKKSLKTLNSGNYSQFINLLFGGKASLVNSSTSPYGCQSGDCSQTMSNVINDYAFTCANRYFANQAAASSAKPGLYIYQFKQETTNTRCNMWPGANCAGSNSMVCHANELIYVFNTPSNYSGCSFQNGGATVSNAMVDYWTSFATSQAPGTGIGQGWPATWQSFQLTPQTPSTNALYLQIAAAPTVASDPLDASAHCSSFWDTQIGYEAATAAWSRVLRNTND